MRVLLDTHLVLWVMNDDPMLSGSARQLLAEASAVFVSAATIWEIAIKAALGKLDVDMDELLNVSDEAGFERLPVTWEHGRAVRDLPQFHRDPFDRMLIAQAVSEPLQFMTHDSLLKRYGDLILVV